MLSDGKVIDSASIESIESSLSGILNIPVKDIKLRLENLRNIDEDDFKDIADFYHCFRNEINSSSLDGLILYHKTRLSDTMKNNIAKKGLLPLKYILDDWINELFCDSNDRDDILLKIKSLSKDFECIYALLYIYENKSNHFYKHPELVQDIFQKYSSKFNIFLKKYSNLEEYKNNTKPYNIKIYVDMKYLEDIKKEERELLGLSKVQYYICCYLKILYNEYKKISPSEITPKIIKCDLMDIILKDNMI